VPPLRRLVLLLVACVALTSCRVDGTIDVDVRSDGAGTVRVAVAFDDDAAARVPDLAGQLRVDDLTAAGWTVTGPAKEPDGRTVVRAEKAFATADQLPAVLAEVTGTLQDVRLERTRSFGRTQWTFTGTVDLSGGAAAFSDAQLAALLGGLPLGQDVAALEHETGGTLAADTSLGLAVTLPGDVSGNATTIDGRTGRWTFRLDQPPGTGLELHGTQRSRAASIWAGVALAAAGSLVLLALVRILRGGRRRRGGLGPSTPAPTEPARRRLELVVVAAHGVLWESQVTADEWLAHLVAQRGAPAPAGQIRRVLDDAMVGRLGSAELWAALGVAGDPAELDAAYVARFSLAPGVDDFVDAMARRGIGVACISNDVGEWSRLLRRRFGLEARIRPWVISAEVGVRKPDPAIYDALSARAGVPLRNCLFLDDRPEHLDAARRLGMSTVLVAPEPGTAPPRDSPHRRVSGLADLLRARAT
jgi:putative hydrolase of the HAD superfamily